LGDDPFKPLMFGTPLLDPVDFLKADVWVFDHVDNQMVDPAEPEEIPLMLLPPERARNGVVDCERFCTSADPAAIPFQRQ